MRLRIAEILDPLEDCLEVLLSSPDPSEMRRFGFQRGVMVASSAQFGRPA